MKRKSLFAFVALAVLAVAVPTSAQARIGKRGSWC